MQINPLLIKKCFIRGLISPIMIEKFSLGKNSIKIKKRMVLKSKGNPENKSLSFLAKF